MNNDRYSKSTKKRNAGDILRLSAQNFFLNSDSKNNNKYEVKNITKIALFGKSAKDWHDDNPNKKGNIRDYASTLELAILSNLEFQNAKLIEQGLNKKERLILLNKEANREKELFNKNKEKAIYKLENK